MSVDYVIGIIVKPWSSLVQEGKEQSLPLCNTMELFGTEREGAALIVKA